MTRQLAFALFALASLLSGCSSSNDSQARVDPTGPSTDDTEPKVPQANPPIVQEQPKIVAQANDPETQDDRPAEELEELDAVAFGQEFRDNEEAAIAKYTDKWVRLRGKVEERVHYVGQVDGGFVTLSGPKFANTSARLPPEELDKVNHITVTREIVVQGKFDEKSVAGIFLKSCEVLQLGDDPAIETDPADLFDEYVKDAEAAANKFRGKPIRITAEIVRMDEKNHSIYLNGGEIDGDVALIELKVGIFEYPYDSQKFEVGDTVIAQGLPSEFKDRSLSILSGHIVQKAVGTD